VPVPRNVPDSVGFISHVLFSFASLYRRAMGFAPEQLRDKALAAVEEAAEQARKRPLERSKALAFALAYLWAYAGGDRSPFVHFWRSLASENDIGRGQNVTAALNAVRRAVARR
jgi:hypothetical protein